MRKRLISQLDYKERQWFYKAIIQMIISDKSIAKEELEDLKETLQIIAGKELKDFKDIITSSEFAIPLKPMAHISFEHAFIIMAEIARVAAIDSKVVLEEKEVLKEILSLLKFKESAIDKVISWTEKLALVYREEESLRNDLKESFE